MTYAKDDRYKVSFTITVTMPVIVDIEDISADSLEDAIAKAKKEMDDDEVWYAMKEQRDLHNFNYTLDDEQAEISDKVCPRCGWHQPAKRVSEDGCEDCADLSAEEVEETRKKD
jgi:hypothetical protein